MKTIKIFVAVHLTILTLSCSSRSDEVKVDSNNSGNTGQTTNPKFVKIFDGRFAIKDDGSFWGWGGVNGYEDGYKEPKQLFTGGVKDCRDGYVVKDNGTLWQLGKQNLLTYMAASCGPFQGQTFSPQGYDNHVFTQIGSDANWNKIGVRNNGLIYNVIIQPVFSYNYWATYPCKGWYRDLNYFGVGWQADRNFTDWKYTNIFASLGLRSNGELYEIGFFGDNNIPQINYSDLIKIIDNNVTDVLNESSSLLYKKNNGTIWSVYLNPFSQYVKTQILGDWKSLNGFSNSDTYKKFTGIKSDGTLWAWGDNRDGFLGDGTYTNQTNPVKISDKTDWVQVSRGIDYYTALDSKGNIYGWGKNNQGQLGDGTTTDKYTPTLVIPAK